MLVGEVSLFLGRLLNSSSLFRGGGTVVVCSVRGRRKDPFSLFSFALFPWVDPGSCPRPKKRGQQQKHVRGGAEGGGETDKNGKGKRMGKSGKELFLSFIFCLPSIVPLPRAKQKEIEMREVILLTRQKEFGGRGRNFSAARSLPSALNSSLRVPTLPLLDRQCHASDVSVILLQSSLPSVADRQ